MYEAVNIAATGLSSQQRRLDTIADNVSNVNTVGFTASRLDFKDALYSAGFGPAPAYTPGEDQQKGHGVLLTQISKYFTTGSLLTSESELDFAIEGDAFFEVQDPYGNLLYTKSGNFYKSVQDDGVYLVNSSGYYAMDNEGNRIEIPEGTTRVALGEDGTISFMDSEGVAIDTTRFGLYTFDNKMGLEANGVSNFTVTVQSGDKIAAEDVTLRQYFLEGSNVNLAEEMTRLIRTQRMYSLASRALSTADDMEGIANSMKR